MYYNFQFNVWKVFIEINSENLNEKPIQFQNLQFKNNVKIEQTGRYLYSFFEIY